jgi:hypothetical protein
MKENEKEKKMEFSKSVGRIEFTHASSAFTNDHPPTPTRPTAASVT